MIIFHRKTYFSRIQSAHLGHHTRRQFYKSHRWLYTSPVNTTVQNRLSVQTLLPDTRCYSFGVSQYRETTQHLVDFVVPTPQVLLFFLDDFRPLNFDFGCRKKIYGRLNVE
ncbi:hypothetical protein Bbelb_213640 [Branchiostoma belcheri]|nr:hypothetical protein Bbelb_213640 [Branchiostoma belcheri]